MKPGCGELQELGLIRATYSTAYLFRDKGNGSIEVYMRAFMDPGGKLRDGIAVLSACTALISIWRMTIAGQNKKLAYMVPTHLMNQSRPTNTNIHDTKGCPLCAKSMSSLLSSATRCDMYNDLARVPTQICKSCITAAAKLNAIDVAISEQVLDARRTVRLHSCATSSSTGSRPRRSPSASTIHSTGSSSYDTQASDVVSVDSASTFSARVLSRVRYSDDECQSVASPAYDSRPGSRSVATSNNSDDESAFSADQARVDLWIRMNQLRVAVEEAYQLTRHNGTVMADAIVANDLNTQLVDPRLRRPRRY